MFQFGEILTLAICFVTVVYVLANWRRIRALGPLAPFVWPFLILVAAWIATVVEGMFLEGGQVPLLVLGQESIGIAHQSLCSELFNLVEHASYAAAAVWLLVLVLRGSKRGREASA